MGLRKYIGDLARKAEGDVRRILDPSISSFSERVTRIGGELQPKRPARDAVSEMRAMELRSYVRTVDPVERPLLLQEAVNTGDVELLFAVADAPKIFKLLPPDTIADALPQWARLSNPEKGELLDRLSSSENTVRYALNRALQILHDAAPAAADQAPILAA